MQNNGNFVFADFSGLTMAETTALKRELKKESIGFKVLKKSLLGFAFREAGADWNFDLSAHRGSLALAYGSAASEAGAIAKPLDAFSRVHKKLALLGGFLMGRLMSTQEITALALLPSREVLLGQVLAMLLSPVSGLARVLDGVRRRVSSE